MQCGEFRRLLDEECDQIILTNISYGNFEKLLNIFYTGMVLISPNEVIFLVILMLMFDDDMTLLGGTIPQSVVPVGSEPRGDIYSKAKGIILVRLCALTVLRICSSGLC